MSEIDAMAAQFADAALPFSDPEGAAARASAEPMSMYVERAARCPVERIGDDFVVLLRMADILYVNKHHDVEQASKYLGSSRPAIPLGLDGAEHRKYRRLLDPVFTAKRVAPLADNVRALADEMIDTFIDDGEVRAYERWCEPLPSTIFLSILGLAARRPRRLPALQEPHPRQRVRHPAVRRGDGAPRGGRGAGSTTTSTACSTTGSAPTIPATTCSAGSSPPRWRVSVSHARTSSTSSGC